MTDELSRVATDIRFLLHPYDRRDTPTPGFPTGQAFVAFVRQSPVEAVMGALIDVIAEDGWPQQAMAASTLRELGSEVAGSWSGGRFIWTIKMSPDSEEVVITPDFQPITDRESDRFFDEELSETGSRAGQALFGLLRGARESLPTRERAA